MEFNFNINTLLKDEMTKVTCDTLSAMSQCSSAVNLRGYSGGGGRLLHRVGTGTGLGGGGLSSVIDSVGKASANAQALPGTITTAHRLQTSSHHLYIMKDSTAHSGLGSIIGILKVGQKKLFILDHQGGMHEMTPLCVLDFYIHESKQRKGCGVKLFKFMLQCERIQAEQLAIDKPSPKLISFMIKHFNLRATVPQVNNFVIFESFFVKQTQSPPPYNNPMNRPPLPPNNTRSGNNTSPTKRNNVDNRWLGCETTMLLPPINPASSPHNDRDRYESSRLQRGHAHSSIHLNNLDINTLEKDRSYTVSRPPSPKHQSAPSSPLPLHRQPHKPWEQQQQYQQQQQQQHLHIQIPVSSQRRKATDHHQNEPPLISRISKDRLYTPGVSDPQLVTTTDQHIPADPLSLEIAELKQVLHNNHNISASTTHHIPTGSANGTLGQQRVRRDSSPSVTGHTSEPPEASYHPADTTANYCVNSIRKPRLHSSWNVLGVPPSHESNNNNNNNTNNNNNLLWQRNRGGRSSTRL